MLPDSDTSKINACAENVFEIWQRTAEDGEIEHIRRLDVRHFLEHRHQFREVVI